MVAKERLDILLTLRGLCSSREQAQRCVIAGEVWQGTNRLEKPGIRLATDALLELRPRTARFVSRGGFKLEHGLKTFGIKVENRVCLDIGASTGGFTDCLLQNGASRVFAVDCGIGQLDQKLRSHPQVVCLEKTNARYLTLNTLAEAHPEANKLSFACADASFISLRLLIEPLQKALPQIQDWLLLFKPQFEVGPENLGKGGRVRNPAATIKALETFDASMAALGLHRRQKVADSPLTGKKSGNQELLLHYEKA